MIAFVRACLLALGIGGLWVATGAMRRPDPAAVLVRHGAEAPTVLGPDTVDRSAGLARLSERMTPFRLSQATPATRFGISPAPRQDVPPPPPKPRLILRGLVSGATRMAIIEGIPGREGQAVIQQGDSSGGVKVERIGRMTALLSGFDTTWALKMEIPWK